MVVFVSPFNKIGTAIRPEIKCQNAVDYPSVLVTAKFTPMNSMGNDKHFEVLQAVFKRFDKICSSDTVSYIGISVDFYRIFSSSCRQRVQKAVKIHFDSEKKTKASTFSYFHLFSNSLISDPIEI